MSNREKQPTDKENDPAFPGLYKVTQATPEETGAIVRKSAANDEHILGSNHEKQKDLFPPEKAEEEFEKGKYGIAVGIMLHHDRKKALEMGWEGVQKITAAAEEAEARGDFKTAAEQYDRIIFILNEMGEKEVQGRFEEKKQHAFKKTMPI